MAWACRARAVCSAFARVRSCVGVRWVHSPPSAGPLAGVRVIDMTRILAGPWATMLLGDLGADVIKVEVPDRGDDSRSWGPPFVGSGRHKQSAYFLCCNRNKRSIAVDVKTPAGVDLVHRLVAQADVFVENFLPGKLDGMGLGYDALAAINPRLVYASISGFGATGPLAHRAGYDVAISAYGGLLSITGPADGEPCKVGVAMTDIMTGLYTHAAILAALLGRHVTGRGQKVDTSLLEVQIAALANVGSNVLNANWPTHRWGTAHESIAPYQAFPTSDGGSLILAVMSDDQWRKFATAMSHPEWVNDARYATNAARVANRSTLVSMLSAVTRTYTRAALLDVCAKTGLTAAPINTVPAALAEPQVLHRGMVVDMPAAGGGEEVIRMTGLPVKFSDPEAAPHIRLPPPLLGQHSEEVMREVLGMDAGAIAGLVSAGVVQQWAP